MPYEELLADVQCPPELARLLLLAWQGKATADVLQAAATTGATSTKPAKRSTRATRARTRGARGAAKSRGGTGNSSGASPDADCAPGGVTLPLRCTYSALTQVLDTDDSVRIMQDTVCVAHHARHCVRCVPCCTVRCVLRGGGALPVSCT